jgi:hypothetical protein
MRAAFRSAIPARACRGRDSAGRAGRRSRPPDPDLLARVRDAPIRLPDSALARPFIQIPGECLSFRAQPGKHDEPGPRPRPRRRCRRRTPPRRAPAACTTSRRTWSAKYRPRLPQSAWTLREARAAGSGSADLIALVPWLLGFRPGGRGLLLAEVLGERVGWYPLNDSEACRLDDYWLH